MAWIEGTQEKTFEVDAPVDEVAAFFCEPAEFQACLTQVVTAEEVEPMVWRWVLEEKAEKGINYQADYTVAYERIGEGSVRWETREGNMRSEGVTECREIAGGRTEVHHKETIATDLPIPRLMAKVFSPIVSREIRKGVTSFLDCARQRLEAK